MTRTRTTWRASLALAAVSAAALGLALPAQASTENPSDPNFTSGATDIVGVGSDTSQILVHYLADGNGTLNGFNAGKTTGRIASFAADGTPASISLRGGTAITRPNGSGAGKSLLYAPNNNPDVTFARSSSKPSDAEISAGLQFFPFALDGLKIAVKATGSNAPAEISVANLLAIYKGDITKWNQIPGNEGGSSETIQPLIPQAGSGTRSYFLSLLAAANNGVTPTVVAASTQEHSDVDIKDNPNALAPFSTARASSDANIKLIGGLDATRPLYNVLRASDATKPELLSIFGKNGFICSTDGRALIEAAGFKQLAAQNRGGVCGVPTQSATTNLRTSDQAEGTQVTTASLDALGSPSGKVELSATLTPVAAAGTVQFFEGNEAVTEPIAVSGGSAETTLTGVAAGQHSYTAVFTPTDVNAYGPSTSDAATALVADAKYSGVISAPAVSGTWGSSKSVDVTIKDGGNNATGAVQLYLNGADPVSADLSAGKASFALADTLAVGTYWGVVSYAGDENFAKDFSIVKVTVTKASTKTAIKLAASRVKVKKATKASVAVTINGTTQKAAGTVTFKIGSTTVGTARVSGGKATVTLKAQSRTGKKTVKATFTPSSSNYGSSTATASYTVVK